MGDVNFLNKNFSLRNVTFIVAGLILTIFFPIFGGIFLCYRLSPIIRLKSTGLEKFVISLLIFLVGNALLYVVANLLHFSIAIQVAGVFYYIIGHFIPRENSQPEPVISRVDVVALCAGLIAFGFLLFPIAYGRHNHQGGTESAFHLLTAGEDNASHFALFKYDIKHSGYSYSSNVSDKGLITTLVDYSQGSEFSAAWLVRSVIGSGNINNNSILIDAYYLSCVFIYSTLVFLTTLLPLKLFENKRQKLNPISSTIVIALSVVLLTIGPLLALQGRGFYSQIFSYVYMMALLLVFVLQKDKSEQRSVYVIALGMLVGIIMSWWFLLPIATVPVLVFYLKNKDRLGYKLLFFAGLLLLLSIYPILLGFLASTSSGSVNQVGGIDKLSYWMVSFYILGSLVLVVPLVNKRQSTVAQTIISWGLFTLLVAIYQLVTNGHVEYYFYKSLYTIVLLGAAGIIYLSAMHTERLSSRVNGRWKILSSIAFSLLAIIALWVWKPVYPRVYAHDWYNNLVTPQNLDDLLKASNGPAYQDYIFVGSCDNAARYITNRWSGAIYLSEGPPRKSLDLDSLNNDSKAILKDIKNLTGKRKIYVNGDKNCLDSKLYSYLLTHHIDTNLR